MYESWQKAYRDLKKKRRNRSAVWYSRQIAKLEIGVGRNADTIRKHMTAARHQALRSLNRLSYS